MKPEWIWGFQWEVSYKLASDSFTSWRMVRRFLLSVEGSLDRVHKAHRCWWPHGVLTVLGLSIGAGIYVDRGPLVAARPSCHAIEGEKQ
jgi:hypothetical protein